MPTLHAQLFGAILDMQRISESSAPARCPPKGLGELKRLSNLCVSFLACRIKFACPAWRVFFFGRSLCFVILSAFLVSSSCKYFCPRAVKVYSPRDAPGSTCGLFYSPRDALSSTCSLPYPLGRAGIDMTLVLFPKGCPGVIVYLPIQMWYNGLTEPGRACPRLRQYLSHVLIQTSHE